MAFPGSPSENCCWCQAGISAIPQAGTCSAGHSLGGAVAALCALRLLHSGTGHDLPAVSCIGFGTPPLGNRALAGLIKRRTWDKHIRHIRLAGMSYRLGVWSRLRHRRLGARSLRSFNGIVQTKRYSMATPPTKNALLTQRIGCLDYSTSGGADTTPRQQGTALAPPAPPAPRQPISGGFVVVKGASNPCSSMARPLRTAITNVWWRVLLMTPRILQV